MTKVNRNRYQKTSNDIRQRIIAAVVAGASHELVSRTLNVKIWTVRDLQAVLVAEIFTLGVGQKNYAQVPCYRRDG